MSPATSSTRSSTTGTPAIPEASAAGPREQLDRRPEEVLRAAVKGMLPKNRSGSAADHEAQDLCGTRASARAAGAGALMGGQMSHIAQYRDTGKPKTSVARVILDPGTGTRGSTADDRGLLSACRPPDFRAGAVADRRGRGHLRHPRPGSRRRPERTGRRRSSRHRPCARRGRSRVAHPAQAGRLPDARRSYRRAQKGGPAQARKAPQFSKR